MEHIFRFRDFIFESQEEFTDEEYALRKNYERKTYRKEPRTPEEARAYNKWRNLKKTNPAAIARFMKDNTPLTQKEYDLYLNYSNKNAGGVRQEITQAEKDVYNKYQRLKDRGIDPFLNVIRKTHDLTPFTEAEHVLYLSYEKKHREGNIQEIKEEEKEAYRKYYRLRARGLDSLVNIPIKELDYTPMTEQEKELQKRYQSKRYRKLDHEISQEEVKAHNKYARLIFLQDDVSLDPTRPFAPEETSLYKIYLDKMKRGETPSSPETKAANRFDFLRRVSDEDLE
jgi:hypothetical protein